MAREITLSTLIKHRFIHCVNHRNQSAQNVVLLIGLTPGIVCQVIAGKNVETLPIEVFYRFARWLDMPLSSVMELAGAHPKLPELVRFALRAQGNIPSNTVDQESAAREAGLSPATFRRALHGYADFCPSLRTCDHLADWLAWTGFTADEIAASAGMLVRYTVTGRRVAVTPTLAQTVKPYPCACGRPGCMVPAHVPCGPHRKWRSDSCRMWATRRVRNEGTEHKRLSSTKSPCPTAPVRFITINEHLFPVRN